MGDISNLQKEMERVRDNGSLSQLTNRSPMTASNKYTAISKDEKKRAITLIKRYCWLSRNGLPHLGYPKMSIEQSIGGSGGSRGAYEVHLEDELTFSIMASMALQLRTITRLKFGLGLTVKEIAQRESLTQKMIRTRVDAVVSQIVHQCLYRSRLKA
tara:strand:- start:948 stop:1418 length:471 start_codon:yes stop_codon:yes gene_type:complete